MAKFDKSDLKKKFQEQPDREFVLNFPDGTNAEISYRRIRTMGEFDELSKQIEIWMKHRDLKHPEVAGRSDDEIMAAFYIAKVATDPELDGREAMELVDLIGPQAKVFLAEIMKFSGLMETSVKEEVEKLRTDSFSANGDAPVCEVSEEAPV
jgi:hypothetical protein